MNCDRVLRLKQLFREEIHIPILIMTSPLNHTATIDYILVHSARAPSLHSSNRTTSSGSVKRT